MYLVQQGLIEIVCIKFVLTKPLSITFHINHSTIGTNLPQSSSSKTNPFFTVQQVQQKTFYDHDVTLYDVNLRDNFQSSSSSSRSLQHVLQAPCPKDPQTILIDVPQGIAIVQFLWQFFWNNKPKNAAFNRGDGHKNGARTRIQQEISAGPRPEGWNVTKLRDPNFTKPPINK